MGATTTEILHTTAGNLPLEEIELEIQGRTWRIRYAGAVASDATSARSSEARDAPIYEHAAAIAEAGTVFSFLWMPHSGL